MTALAMILATIATVLAGLHLAWAIGGLPIPSTVIPTTAQGRAVIAPGRVSTFAVSVALLLAAAICLRRAELLCVGPAWIGRYGTWAVAAAFFARAIGEGRYCGLTKRVRGTTFASWDDRVFTPLCLVIATLAALLAHAA